MSLNDSSWIIAYVLESQIVYCIILIQIISRLYIILSRIFEKH